jgi:arylsulfatase A-like enzyme
LQDPGPSAPTGSSPGQAARKGAGHSLREDDIFTQGRGPDGSFFIGPLRRLLPWRSGATLDAQYRITYPRGLPDTLDLFRLEDVVDGVIRILGGLPRSSLAYLNLHPPHADYRPKGKYNHSFDDGWQPAPKPEHVLVWEKPGPAAEETRRLHYDQYLASWDAELARLLDYLWVSGILDDSYVIITSDHGEMFERGVVGHMTPLIYDPSAHVPLIISMPGQNQRVGVRTPTSSIDLLPTVASLAGLTVPPWASGRLLPELGETSDPGRSIFTIDAKSNSAFAALDSVSVSLTKDEYRLTYYHYPDQDYEGFELDNLLDDPEELRDVFQKGVPAATTLKDELLHELQGANLAFHG